MNGAAPVEEEYIVLNNPDVLAAEASVEGRVNPWSFTNIMISPPGIFGAAMLGLGALCLFV